MLKLFVFDWDGTLADSISQIIACKQCLAKKYHLPIPDQQVIKSVLGMDFHAALKICFPKVDNSVLHVYGDEFKTLMQTPEFHAHLFSGALKVLMFLKTLGVKLAVATSKSRQELTHSMEKTGLSDLFDITCCGEEHLPKPSPAMLLHILTALKIQPKESIYIGDAVIDIIFAKNAQVDVVSVLFGAGSRNDIERHSPKFMIESWDDFLQTVLENVF